MIVINKAILVKSMILQNNAFLGCFALFCFLKERERETEKEYMHACAQAGNGQEEERENLKQAPLPA